MRFSEFHGIEQPEQEDWFDTLLPADTHLCVDPFLIYDDPDPFWAPAHDRILDFFGLVFGLIRDSRGHEGSLSWQQAKQLLLFPEPAEFCLGVAEGSPRGSGTGAGLQEGMLAGVRTAVLGLGMDNLEHMEMLALFQGGMGLDRVSDAVCNILKSYFIRYTQDVCRRHGVPMKTFRVRNADWSETFARWQDREIELPANPFLDQPVLLTPRRFLKDIPVVTADAFWRYAWSNHAEALRNDFNFDLARNVDRRTKAKLARQNPDIVAQYLRKVEQQDHEPYPVETDPKFRVKWWEKGAELAKRSPLHYVAAEPHQFPKFVRAVVEAFRHGIQNCGEWALLWYRNISLPESKAQLLFRGTAVHYCEANNIDLSREPNAGRGPVDFKFSQGWSARALVEIKLMRSSRLWDGLLAQTPQYAVSEEVQAAVFVAIAYEDAELQVDRVAKVRRAAELASSTRGLEIVPVIIDARPKESASKLKAPKSVKRELHEPDDGPDGGVPAVAA